MCLPTDDNEARRKTDRKDETIFKFVDYEVSIFSWRSKNTKGNPPPAAEDFPLSSRCFKYADLIPSACG